MLNQSCETGTRDTVKYETKFWIRCGVKVISVEIYSDVACERTRVSEQREAFWKEEDKGETGHRGSKKKNIV